MEVEPKKRRRKASESPSSSASASSKKKKTADVAASAPTSVPEPSASTTVTAQDPAPQKATKKKKSGPGPKEKFDYEDPVFYETIQELASAGYSDASIAYGLADKFGKSLTPESFSRFKNETNDNGEPTQRNILINQALTRGRSGILQAARSTYYQMALGQRKTSIVRRNAVQKRCPCCFENDMTPKEDCTRCGGTGWYYLTDKVITEESEMEIAPNMQALATFLYNNDPEWRENILRKKREEAEAAAAGGDSSGLPTAVNIRITYNQKEDLALQEKFKKPKE